MADVVKDLIGTWNVSFKTFRWAYTFSAGGTVTWRDIFNGKTGTGSWTHQESKIVIAWRGSKTEEKWRVPINPARQEGTIVADYASGELIAIKDQTNFDAVPPEGQLDAFACWAASLAWYTRASADVATMPQLSFLPMCKSLGPNGSITLNGLMTISLPNVYLVRSQVNSNQLMSCLKARPFPLLIAFATGPMGGHVNVIHRYDSKTETVKAMEPWNPDPAKDRNYILQEGVFIHKVTRTPFKFTGAHVTRPLSYYTSKPLTGQFVIGHNAKFGRTC